MPLFGEDPKDEVIANLKDEVSYLRQILQEKDAQILAMTNAAAYRMMNPNAVPDPPAAPPGLLEERHVPFVPKLSTAEVKSRFGSDS